MHKCTICGVRPFHRPSISSSSSPSLPLLFLLLCGFLFPLSRFLWLYLFLIFPDACPSVVAAVWANKQARGPSESQTACCGFLFAWVDPRAGESFLKRCAERSKAQRRDCNTNICPPLPPAPDVHSVLPPPRRKRKDSSLILSKGEICPTDSDILPNRLAKVQSPGFIHVVMIVV